MKRLLLAIALLAAAPAWAADRPRTDCGAAAAFDAGETLPRIGIFFGGDFADWVPPSCSGWTPRPFTVMVETEGVSARAESTGDILSRLGRISAYADIRYWSTTRGRWRDLVPEASALSAADPAARRPDFTAAELREGPHFFWQQEHTPLDEVTYRLDVVEASDAAITVRLSNALPARASLFETLPPGAHEFVYALRRRDDGRWTIYGLMRTGNGPSLFAAAGRRSYGNRAVALYRHLAGETTDGAPPLFP
jgi:hypothetical protein